MAKKPTENIRSFKIYEIHEEMSQQIIHSLKDYKQLENMLNILIQDEYDKQRKNTKAKDKNYSMVYALFNPVLMKAVIMGCKGGEATEESIAAINEYYKDHAIFQQIKSFGQTKDVNDKNVSMVVRRLKKDWENFFEANKEWKAKKRKGKGRPRPPKAKALNRVYNWSLPIEADKFKRHEKGFRLTLGKKGFHLYLGRCEYLNEKYLTSLTVGMSHGHVYYSFQYKLPKTMDLFLPVDDPRPIIEAGLDIGVHNLFALIINDDNPDNSLLYNAKALRTYNQDFNKHLKRLKKELTTCVTEYVTKKVKQGNKIVEKQFPKSYNWEGHEIQHAISDMWFRRNLYFESEMDKISSVLLDYLKEQKVTDLVISKNLSFTKTSGAIKGRKKFTQEFYQIPFGKLLNKIIQKSVKYKIRITEIDEAYTSKTSCLSGDVRKVQQLATEERKKLEEENKVEKAKAKKEGRSFTAKKRKVKIPSNELNGVRGRKRKKGQKPKKSDRNRGDFYDAKLKKLWNADLNGAFNHIKVAFENLQMKSLEIMLRKLSNARTVKSCNEFNSLSA